jgi:short-chain fatty acids transporter
VRALALDRPVIERLGAAFAAGAERWAPSPFVLALVLTAVTFGLGITVAGGSPGAALVGWGSGFWDFLSFAMQMCLVLVTGHALAVSGPVRRAIDRLASLPRGTRSAAALAAFVSVVLSLVHWGLGLVVGALLAREIGRVAARRGIEIHYPLVVAGAYAGFLSWHGGLSGSAPLTVATPGHFLEKEIGVVSVTRTLASPGNLLLGGLLVVSVPLFVAGMAPRGRGRPAPAEVLAGGPPAAEAGTGRGFLDRGRLLGVVFGAVGLALVARAFARAGIAALDLNLVNFLFLFAGFLLHGSPAAYARAVEEGLRGASGIVLQFPFYAGILGMMRATGLVEWMAHAGASAGRALYLPSTFVAAAVVNLFVPSGGGQWGVQGPIAVHAARQLGVPIEKAVMAVAYGDEWTNMLQPFWALALLGVTRLEARDILGYTTLVMLLTGPFYVVALLVR